MVRSLTLTGWTRLQALTNAVAEQSRQGVMPESLNRFVFELRSLEAEVAEVDLAVCPYEGEQLVQGYQGVKWWVCPLCGTEHEEDFADE